MITKDEVFWGYRLLLGREPESERAVEHTRKSCTNRGELVSSLLGSAEFKTRNPQVQPSPFWHYAAAFDAIATMNTHKRDNLRPSPGHVMNFLGVKVRPEVFPSILGAKAGTVEGMPFPSNWHADIAEWASCLHAVDLSSDRFTMLELGCGWGCWMNNLGVAAKNAGKKIKLYGVEADPDHLGFARTALADNNISPSEYALLHGIAGAKGSVALFPKIESGINWGGTAIFAPTTEQLADAEKSNNFVRLPIIDIPKILRMRTSLICSMSTFRVPNWVFSRSSFLCCAKRCGTSLLGHIRSRLRAACTTCSCPRVSGSWKWKDPPFSS